MVYPFASQIPCRPNLADKTLLSHGVLSTQTTAQYSLLVCTASNTLCFVLNESFVIVSVLHMKDCPYENSTNSYGEQAPRKEHSHPS
jgi:hypothetical protein